LYTIAVDYYQNTQNVISNRLQKMIFPIVNKEERCSEWIRKES